MQNSFFQLDVKDFLQDFSLSEVEITDSYCKNLVLKDVDFLNTFNPDKLLYNFRLTAGFSKEEIKAKYGTENCYGGWENTRIGGHTLGHYLGAVGQAIKAGYGSTKGKDNISLNERLEIILDGLTECQNKNDLLPEQNSFRKKGFIFGATIDNPQNLEIQFDKLEQGNPAETWVPWYTMHKIMNGLVEVYKQTENQKALNIALNLGEWIYERTKKWTEETKYKVLETEYGGMNDCLYELYKCAKKTDYKNLEHIEEAAHKFDQITLFEEINSGKKDSLNNRHANTTIPKYMGALNRYRTFPQREDSQKYLEYVINFWDLVVNHHTYITGGNSECEHFGKDDVLDLERSNCNNETCNTHNMLKITRELFKITGEKKYADYYENTFINSILASCNSENGMTTYFQPMSTGNFKIYCNEDVDKNYFWCCTGTGLENFTKLGDSFYFHNEKSIYVNQFISSKVTWTEKNITLIQNADLPYSNKITITIKTQNGAKINENDFSIFVRIPDWAEVENVTQPAANNTIPNHTSQLGASTPKEISKIKSASSLLNELKQEENSKIKNGYIEIKNNWNDGDKVEIEFKMKLQVFSLPDNKQAYAFKYGPVVLAADLGTDDFMNIRQVGVLCDVCAVKKVLGKTLQMNGNYGGTSNLPILPDEILQINEPVESFIKNIEKHLVKNEETNPKLSFTLLDTNWNYDKNSNQTLNSESNSKSDTTLNSNANSKAGSPLIFTEYYKINKGRYGIYWIFDDGKKSYPNKVHFENKLKKEIIQGIGIGYGTQTEGNETTFPCMKESANGSVGDSGALTRYAKKGGSFSYLFEISKNQKNYISCEFLKEDDGKNVKICALDKNGSKQIEIANCNLDSSKCENSAGETSEKYELFWEIPEEVKNLVFDFEGKNVVRISFSGKNYEESARICAPANTFYFKE